MEKMIKRRENRVCFVSVTGIWVYCIYGVLFLEEKVCTYSRFDFMVVKSARRMGLYVVITFFTCMLY
jgi:hypothetical protein